jgi:hypothetical protein
MPVKFVASVCSHDLCSPILHMVVDPGVETIQARPSRNRYGGGIVRASSSCLFPSTGSAAIIMMEYAGRIYSWPPSIAGHSARLLRGLPEDHVGGRDASWNGRSATAVFRFDSILGRDFARVTVCQTNRAFVCHHQRQMLHLSVNALI